MEVYQYDAVRTLLRNVVTMTKKAEYDWLNEYIGWRGAYKNQPQMNVAIGQNGNCIVNLHVANFNVIMSIILSFMPFLSYCNPVPSPKCLTSFDRLNNENE